MTFLIVALASSAWSKTLQENFAIFKSIQVQTSSESVEVMLEIDGEFGYQHFELSEPSRLVVEFWPIGDIQAEPSREINAHGISSIRVGRFQPQTARVVFDLMEIPPSYEILQRETGIQVVFRAQPGTAAPPPKAIQREEPSKMAAEPAQETHLKSIVYGRVDNRLQIRIGIDGTFTYKAIEYADQSRLVLDFWPVQRLSARPFTNINLLGLQQIDLRKIGVDIVRMEFQFSGVLSDFKIQQVERGVDILFSEATKIAAAKVVPKKEVIIHEPFGNTLFAAMAGIYTVGDSIFHQIYGGEDSPIFGLELSRMLVQSRNFYMGLSFAGKRFSKTGSSTITQEETKFTLAPLTVSARFLWNSAQIIPYVDLGVDFYNYKEESVLGDTSGSTTGSHLQGGLYFKIPGVKFLMLNLYFKYNKATATEEDVKIDIGGSEVGIAISFGFDVLSGLVIK